MAGEVEMRREMRIITQQVGRGELGRGANYHAMQIREIFLRSQLSGKISTGNRSSRTIDYAKRYICDWRSVDSIGNIGHRKSISAENRRMKSEVLTYTVMT